jgi:hypothetical protein
MSNEEKNQFEEPQQTATEERQEQVWENQQPCEEDIAEAESTENPETIESEPKN